MTGILSRSFPVFGQDPLNVRGCLLNTPLFIIQHITCILLSTKGLHTVDALGGRNRDAGIAGGVSSTWGVTKRYDLHAPAHIYGNIDDEKGVVNTDTLNGARGGWQRMFLKCLGLIRRMACEILRMTKRISILCRPLVESKK